MDAAVNKGAPAKATIQPRDAGIILPDQMWRTTGGGLQTYLSNTATPSTYTYASSVTNAP